MTIKLIVGLANPGAEYAATRHNAGAWYVDLLAERHRAAARREQILRLYLAPQPGGGRRAPAGADHLYESQRQSGGRDGYLLPY